MNVPSVLNHEIDEIDAQDAVQEPQVLSGSESVSFVIADETGEIIRHGTCQSVDFPSGGIVGIGSLFTHYVIAGEIIQYTPEQTAAKQNRPFYATTWSNEQMAWLDLRSLDEIKESKWGRIKALRSKAEYAPFQAMGLMFDGDEKSQQRIQGAVQLAQMAIVRGSTFEIEWTLADNSVVELTAPEIVEVGVALATRIQAVYATSRALRAQLAGAATVEEIAAVVWPSEAIG